MAIKELGHLVLYVRDVQRSAHFYRDVLGWRPITTTGPLPFPAMAFNAGGRTHHELLLIEVGESAAPLPPGRRAGRPRTLGDPHLPPPAALRRSRTATASAPPVASMVRRPPTDARSRPVPPRPGR